MTELDRVLQQLYEAALAADDQDTGSIDAFRDARAALTPGLAVLLMEEGERLRRVVECARRLKEGEQIDAKMGYPLSGDSALASYLGTLDEALGDLDDRLEDNDAASERPDHD